MNREHHQTPERIAAAAAAWIGRRDGGLTDAEAAEFEAWRQADPRHAQALARFESAWTAISRPRRHGAAPALAAELERLVRRRRRQRAGGAVLGALFCLAAVGVWSSRPPAQEAREPVSDLTVVAPDRRALPDGTWVEASDRSEWEMRYTAGVRRVVLRRGEALFDVAKDPARPFVVEAGGIEVRAVGTAFAVHASGAAVEVLVTEGQVSVERPTADGLPAVAAGAAPQALAQVAAGHRVRVESATLTDRAEPVAVESVPPAEIGERLAWRRTRLEFSGAPLAKVIEAINRHGKETFVIADPGAGALAVSGVFRADDTPAIVQMLERGFGLELERRDGRIHLRRASGAAGR